MINLNKKDNRKVISSSELLEDGYTKLIKENELLKEEINSLKNILSHKEEELSYYKRELNKLREETNGTGNEDLLFSLSQIRSSIPSSALHTSPCFSMDVDGMLTNITTKLDSTIKKIQQRQEDILNDVERRQEYTRRKLYEI
jgi:cell division septum initiation protein DivIVA